MVQGLDVILTAVDLHAQLSNVQETKVFCQRRRHLDVVLEDILFIKRVDLAEECLIEGLLHLGVFS